MTDPTTVWAPLVRPKPSSESPPHSGSAGDVHGILARIRAFSSREGATRTPDRRGPTRAWCGRAGTRIRVGGTEQVVPSAPQRQADHSRSSAALGNSRTHSPSRQGKDILSQALAYTGRIVRRHASHFSTETVLLVQFAVRVMSPRPVTVVDHVVLHPVWSGCGAPG
jgi:hypothetical protein